MQDDLSTHQWARAYPPPAHPPAHLYPPAAHPPAHLYPPAAHPRPAPRPHAGRGLLAGGAALLVLGFALAVGLIISGISSGNEAAADGHRVSAASGGAMQLGPGHYKIFLETRGAGGSMGSGLDEPVIARISVTGPAGQPIPAPVPSMTETYTMNGRSGTNIAEFTADQPGSYRVTPASPSAGELYVTQHGVLGSVAGILGGLFGGGGLAVLGVILLVVGLVQRSRGAAPRGPYRA